MRISSSEFSSEYRRVRIFQYFKQLYIVDQPLPIELLPVDLESICLSPRNIPELGQEYHGEMARGSTLLWTYAELSITDLYRHRLRPGTILMNTDGQLLPITSGEAKLLRDELELIAEHLADRPCLPERGQTVFCRSLRDQFLELSEIAVYLALGARVPMSQKPSTNKQDNDYTNKPTSVHEPAEAPSVLSIKAST